MMIDKQQQFQLQLQSSRQQLFIFLSGGVFTTYILYGFVEEAIFRYRGFKFGWFLTFCQFLLVSILADYRRRGGGDQRQPKQHLLQLFHHGRGRGGGGGDYYLKKNSDDVLNSSSSSERQQPKQTTKSSSKLLFVNYAIIGLLDCITMGMSNTANQYLNYPTKVLFKSCKLLPVMLLGRLAFGKHYSQGEYVAALLLISGLALITLADNATSKDKLKFNTTGIIMVSISLIADSLMGNLQSMVLQQHHHHHQSSSSSEHHKQQSPYKSEKPPNHSSKNNSSSYTARMDLLFYTYRIGAVYLFGKLLWSGELVPATYYVQKHPSILCFILLFALLAFIGLNFVLSLIDHFDILVTVTTITCRQFFTICLSFWLFPQPDKQFTKYHGLALLLVFVGIWMNICIRNNISIGDIWQHCQRYLPWLLLLPSSSSFSTRSSSSKNKKKKKRPTTGVRRQISNHIV